MDFLSPILIVSVSNDDALLSLLLTKSELDYITSAIEKKAKFHCRPASFNELLVGFQVHDHGVSPSAS